MIDKLQNTLRRWLEDVTGLRYVIYRHQDGPRPPKSFIDLACISLVPIGHPDIGYVDDEGKITILTDYRATVSISFYGEDSGELALRAHRSLRKESERFRVAGLGIEGISSLDAVPAIVDNGKWEKRWHFDLFLNLTATDEQVVGLIEKVQLRMILEADGSVVADEVFQA